MNEPRKLILTKEYREVEMYTCPYCKIVARPNDYKFNEPWCETGYKCPLCSEDVLPNRKMVEK